MKTTNQPTAAKPVLDLAAVRIIEVAARLLDVEAEALRDACTTADSNWPDRDDRRAYEELAGAAADLRTLLG